MATRKPKKPQGSRGTQSGSGSTVQRPGFIETGDSKLFGKPIVKGAAQRQDDTAKRERASVARDKRLRELDRSIHGGTTRKGSPGTQSGEGVWRK